MLKINLKRHGKIVGDLGTYKDSNEAKRIRDNFNTKRDRRGATAEIAQNPNRSLGSLFAGDDSESEDDESSVFEWSEEHEPSIVGDSEEEDESSVFEWSEEHEPERKEQVVERTYRNPLDILPIDPPARQQRPNPRDTIPRKRVKRKRIAPYTLSVQAVMIDDDGYVLIRSPKNRYKGIRWEFYGGTVEGGEELDAALQREIKEETGYTVNLIDFVSDLSIGNTKQKFYLVSPRQFDDSVTMMETEDTFWVSQDEAWEMLGKNKEPYKRTYRNILDKAYTKWRIRNV